MPYTLFWIGSFIELLHKFSNDIHEETWFLNTHIIFQIRVKIFFILDITTPNQPTVNGCFRFWWFFKLCYCIEGQLAPYSPMSIWIPSPIGFQFVVTIGYKQRIVNGCKQSRFCYICTTWISKSLFRWDITHKAINNDHINARSSVYKFEWNSYMITILCITRE